MTTANGEVAVSGANASSITIKGAPGNSRRKGQSRNNAIRHGIFADIVLTGEPFRESSVDYERLLAGLRKAIKPDNGLDETLLEMLAFELLRLSRIYKADTRLGPQLFERMEREVAEGDLHVSVECIDREREALVFHKTLDPELLLRYGSTVTKHIHRLLDRLESRRAGKKS